MSKILEVNGVCKHFQEFTLDNISLTIPTGYIMGFIGENGAGKTTTINLILNMLQKDSGSIQVFGLDHLENEITIKQKIGVVFDNTFYLDEWKVSTVERAISPFYSQWDSATFARYLREFGLSETKKVKDLSRGMKMKLMLAAALSHDAKLLILDEPTSGLDPLARDELMDILSEYIAPGDRSILFSTHITADLERLADYITFIHKGKLVYTGTKDTLMESYRMAKGSIAELSTDQQGLLIGLRKYSTGFEALVRTSDKSKLPTSVLVEIATMDDIMVHISKGGRQDEQSY